MKKVSEAGRPQGKQKKKQGSSQDSLGPSGENEVILISDGDVEVHMDQSTLSSQPNIPIISKKRKSKWSAALISEVGPQAKKDKKSQVAPVAIPEASVTTGTKTGPLISKLSKYKVSTKKGPPLHPGNKQALPVQPSLKKQARVGGDLRNKSRLGFQFQIRRARGRPPGKKHDRAREIIRLKTTDGFWSSKTSSRSSSPLSLEAFTQKQAENKKGSRTSTPDLSGQSIAPQKKGVQENYVSDPLNSITTMPELRRLQTTKGFSFPDITNLGSRVSSRDESPSSSSSLDRSFRTNVRSQNRQTEGTPTEEDNSQVCVVDMAPKQLKKKSRKSDVSKVLEKHKNTLVATPEVSSLGSSKETIKKLDFKCKIKDSTDNQTDLKEPLHKKQRKSKSLPALSPQKTKGRSRFSLSSALKEHTKLHRKQNLDSKMTRKQQNRLCHKEIQASLSNENCVKSVDVGNRLVTGKVDSGVHITVSSSDETIKTPECRKKSELFPLDLLDSKELKRLNTTAGFWAPTPNLKSVFGASRLRKNQNVNSVIDSPTLNKNASPKSQKTHLKPQTPLLQHRKKKLQALQNSLRKTKQRLHPHNLEDVLIKYVSSEKSLGNKHCEQKKPKKRPKKDQPSDPVQIILDVAEDPSYIEEFSTQKNIGNPMETVLPLVKRVKMTKKTEKDSLGQKRLKKNQPFNPIQIVLDIAEDPSIIKGLSTKTNFESLMETVPPIVQTVKKMQKKPKKSIQQKGLRKDQPCDPLQIILDTAEDPGHFEEFSTNTNVGTPMKTVSPLVQKVTKTAKVKKTNNLHVLNISKGSSSDHDLCNSPILQSSFQTAKKRGRKKKEAITESSCAQSITEVQTSSLDKSGITNKKFTDLDETLKQNLLLSASVASLRTKRQKLKEMKKSFSESESNYSDSPETYQRTYTEAQVDIVDGLFENISKKNLSFCTEDSQDGISVPATIATRLQADQAETLNMSLYSGCGRKELARSRSVQLDVSDVGITTKTSDYSIQNVVSGDQESTDLDIVHVNSARCPRSIEKDILDPENGVRFNDNSGQIGGGCMMKESTGFENSENASICKIACVEAQSSYIDSQIMGGCETPKYEDKEDMDDSVRLCLATASNAGATIKQKLTWDAEKRVHSCEGEDKEGGQINDNLKSHLGYSSNMVRDKDLMVNNCKSKISLFETNFGFCNEADNVVGNMSHRKDNLFESFGYDLQSTSKLPGASCVNSSAEEVRFTAASPSFQENSTSYKTEITDESKVHPDYHIVLKSVVETECKHLDDMNFATDCKVETVIDGKSELVCQEKSDIIPASVESSVDATLNHSGANLPYMDKTGAESPETESSSTKLKQEISVETGENNMKKEYSELRDSSVAVKEDNLCVSHVVEVEPLQVTEDTTEGSKDVQDVIASSTEDLNLLNGSKRGDDFSKTCKVAKDELFKEVGRINLIAKIHPNSSDENLTKSRSSHDKTLKSEMFASESAENDHYHDRGVTDENRNVTEQSQEDVDKVASLNVSEDVTAETLCVVAACAPIVVEPFDGPSGEDRSKEINVSLLEGVEHDTPTTESSLQNDQPKQDLTSDVSGNENNIYKASPEPQVKSNVSLSLVFPEETVSEKCALQPSCNPNLPNQIESQEEVNSSNECTIVLCPSPVNPSKATPSYEPVETTSIDDLMLRTNAEHVTGTNICTQATKKLKRRKRNSWQRGVVNKAHSNLVHRRAKTTNSESVRKRKPTVASNQRAVARTSAHILNSSALATGSLSVIQGQNDNIGSASTIDTYPPAVQKSLLTMLKQLKTNANLANAILDEKSFSGRFLRHTPSADKKDKKCSERNDKEQLQSLNSDDLKGEEPLSIFADPEVQYHANSTPLQRKRGRPKKNSIESLPTLTATHTLPSLRPITPWDVTPPTLSPQESAQQNATEDPAGLLDTSEIVGENVDDSDFHLYLSGISDEELSPKKNTPEEVLSPFSIQVHQVTRDLLGGTDTVTSLQEISSTPSSSLITDVALVPELSLTPEASSTSAAFLTPTATSMPSTSLISAISSTPLRSLSPNDKEPKKRGRPAKIKGKRGRPPGLPMTKDEKEKKSDVAQTDTEESNSPEVLRMTKKSTPAPEVSSPPGNFSLRKKSTRSPLEMLELKRRQEEAIYDLEQERRQARLTYLREKRSTRESGEGFLDDTEARAHESVEGVLEDTETVLGSDNVMVCSVVLSDFVKKLQLNEPENSSSGSENEGETGGSPASGEFPDDENWCADLQQQYDEQDMSNRSDSRPYIPRLKLKRILKKRSPVEKARIDPEPFGLQPRPERIKLVIKTEPVFEGNESTVSKQNVLVDNSRVDRLGFESSFMDFLNGKSESLISKVNRRTKPNHGEQILSVNSGHHQPLKDANATNSSLIKIIVDENSLVDIARIPVSSSPDSYQEESSASLLEGNNNSVLVSAYSSGSLNSRPDEEDDDILILDLDESGDEITPHGKLGQNPGTESESVKKPIMNKDTVSQEPCDDEGQDLIDQALLRSQRSLSNDEMGLMLESYYSPARTDTQLVSDGDQMSTCVTSTDTSDIRAYIEVTTDLTSPLQPGLANKDHAKSTTDSTSIEDVNMESSKVVSEVGMKEKRKMTDQSSEHPEPLCKTTNQALSCGQKQNANTSLDSFSGKGAVPVEGEEGSDLTTDAALGSLNRSLEVCDSPAASGSLLPVSLKSVDSVADEDGSAAFPMKTPPKISTSAKKPTSDSSRSPKQISCHGGGLEEWRVKVISQSDKCPSGKFSCKRCDFVTSSKLTVESHIYSHIPGVQFRCAHCQAEFSSMTATATHLKNTHSLNEAQLHISRHIEEKNFYERENGVLEDCNQPQSSPCHPLSAIEGQSPPLFISLVVSGSRASRTSAAHRFVCTHCGFSTNVKEAAEHHISDLHSSDSLYTCLLCSESCSEAEIKAHCAKVHPARNHPYKKLPDFYDAEKLGQKDKAVCQEGCEDFYDRVSSVLQDDGPGSSTSIDHRQKAKAYLELQEGWREKKRAEADSTTAADYTEEPEDEVEEDEAPASGSVQEEDNQNFDDPPIEDEANEVLVHVKLKSGSRVNNHETPECVSKNACITSSAGASPAAPLAEFSAPVSEVPLEEDGSDGRGIEENDMSKSACSLPQYAAKEPCEDLKDTPPCDQDGGSDESIGLKIVQVVSLGELGQDLPMEPVGAEDDSICQATSENMEQNTGSQIVPMLSPEPVNLSLEAEKVVGSTEPTAEPFHDSAQPTVITSAEISKETVSIPDQPVTGSNEQISPAVPAASSSSSSSSPATMPASLACPPFSGSLPLSYKCNACRVHTPYLLMMVKHLKARHPNMRCFSCPYCKTVGGFVSQKQLRHHVKQAHPDKFGRNEIALSEDAKKFVEAMVLPMGLECIRVGNRIVLEEDIHTCTYCQIRMTSLTSVYEHLNTKHPDLFEYVCPICQIYKNSVLSDIANHCCTVHHVDLDNEQVHVSVPKNLFSILTCISKNGKYIEKSLIANSEALTGKSQSSSFTYEPSGKLHPAATTTQSQVDQHTPRATSVLTSVTTQSLLSGSLSKNRVSAGLDMVPRPTVPFSSALFDTSSFTASPHVAMPGSQPILGHSGAASSFLSPKQQQLHFDSQLAGSNKQSHVKLGEKAQGHSKNLPVLNVPTIRPRTSSTITKQAGDPSSTIATTEGLSFQRIVYSAAKTAGPSSCLENIPESEPSPDAFKIFNLRPAPVAHSASPIPTSTPTSVPSVFPPVSAPMASSFIQGPIAGFPPSMVIAPSILPLAFPFPQHRQPMVAVTLVQSQATSLSQPPHQARTSLPKTSTLVTSTHQPSAAATTTLLKNHQQQQRELYKLRQQQLQKTETTQRQRQVSRPSPHQPILPQAYPAHQQPPSLSGQIYQQNSNQVPAQSFQYDRSHRHFAAAGPTHVPQSIGVFSTPTPSTALAAISGQGHTSSPTKPGKGMHKRSNCLYQCPYCPGMIHLKALDVVSHIHQHHSGQQVIFRRIA